MSNGCLITNDDAKRASTIGISDIQISLEGPPDLHDSIRGRGSFMGTAKGVETLVKSGNRVSANVTLSRLNVHQIEETTEVARTMVFLELERDDGRGRCGHGNRGPNYMEVEAELMVD